MSPAGARLSRESWIDTAVDVLRSDGPDEVAVQPLARRLDTTKGSFYWHFRSRDELLDAALDQWAADAGEGLVAAVEQQVPGRGKPAARARCEAVLAEILARSTRHPGELAMLTATGQPAVAAAVESVTNQRIAYLAGLFRSGGLPPAAAGRRATLAYAAWLGYAELARATPASLPASARAQKALVEELTSLLLP